MKSSIMVVDDQKVNRDILHELFTDEFDIIEACDGLEAIEKLGDKEISDSIELSCWILLCLKLTDSRYLNICRIMNLSRRFL